MFQAFLDQMMSSNSVSAACFDLLMIYTVLVKKYNVSRKPEDVDLLNDKRPLDLTRRGSAGIVDSMMLLKSHQSMHAPYTQVVPASRHHLPLSLCSIISL